MVYGESRFGRQPRLSGFRFIGERRIQAPQEDPTRLLDKRIFCGERGVW